jgi:hypothetical protein
LKKPVLAEPTWSEVEAKAQQLDAKTSQWKYIETLADEQRQLASTPEWLEHRQAVWELARWQDMRVAHDDPTGNTHRDAGIHTAQAKLSEVEARLAGGQRKRRESEPQERQRKILEWLVANGYEPKALPVVRGRDGGVKKKAYTALVKPHGIFAGTDSKVFDKAWEALRKSEDIKDA